MKTFSKELKKNLKKKKKKKNVIDLVKGLDLAGCRRYLSSVHKYTHTGS